MDDRVLPFVLPGVGSEEDEAIALLSYVAEGLLTAHHRAVERVRRHAERLSNGLFGAAFLAFFLFLLEDPERAPIPLMVLPLVAMVGLLAAGLWVRTRLVDANRFHPPRIRSAQKLSWQWLAVPLDEERLLLWDALTDEAEQREMPPSPPGRPPWLEHAPDRLPTLDAEAALINRLGDALEAWRAPSTLLHLPHVRDGASDILTLLANLPRRGRRWPPAPALTPPRPVLQGLEEVQRLVELHQTYAVFLRQLDAWEEELPACVEQMKQALNATLPYMSAPPAPPPAHPSGDVEALIGTLDLVRTTAIASLRQPLEDELKRLQNQLNQRLDELEEDWQRERNIVHYGRDTLINSLERRVKDLEQRRIPKAEEALRESRAKLREAEERLRTREEELQEKRKQLLQAGGGSSSSPRASDERRMELNAAIDRLNSTLPEMRISTKSWEEFVAMHESGVDRERQELEQVRQEYRENVEQRDRQLETVDANYQARQEALRAQYAPLTEAIEADLAFFDGLPGYVAAALEPYRVDLIMDDEAVRPYTEVLQQAQQIVQRKQEAVDRWAGAVLERIRQRRQTLHELVSAIDGAALPNFGVNQPRLMSLPIWYVETVSGRVTLWPWRQGKPEEATQLIAPFVEEARGQRLALPNAAPTFLMPLPPLQRRLDSLLEGARGESVCETARRLGRPVPFERKRLSSTALATLMPRAMKETLEPLYAGPLPTGAAPPVPPPTDAPPPEGDAASDAFVLDGTPSQDADAWREERDGTAEADAWVPEGGPVAAPPPSDGSGDGRPSAADAPPASGEKQEASS